MRFSGNAVHVYGYRFPPASVFPYGSVAADRIISVDPASRQLTTRDGEILFIGSERSLNTLHTERDIPIVRRLDVWSLIVEPFLIMTFDDEHAAETLRTLEENGISRAETVDLRRLLEDEMTAYNSFFQEASENTMKEVLCIKFSGLLFSSWNKSKREEFRDFYWRFMEIALRAKTFDTNRSSK